MHHYKSKRESWELTCAINFSMEGKDELIQAQRTLGKTWRRAPDIFVMVRYSKKQLGMAAGAGFVGGSAFGHGSSLASYSVYHRWPLSDNGDFESFPQGTRGTGGTVTAIIATTMSTTTMTTTMTMMTTGITTTLTIMRSEQML